MSAHIVTVFIHLFNINVIQRYKNVLITGILVNTQPYLNVIKGRGVKDLVEPGQVRIDAAVGQQISTLLSIPQNIIRIEGGMGTVTTASRLTVVVTAHKRWYLLSAIRTAGTDV